MGALTYAKQVTDEAHAELDHALGAQPQAQPISVGESVTRGALALLSTQPLTWGVSLLAIIAVPQLLGAEALGQYTIAVSIATLGFTGFNLGLPDYLVRHFAQRPASYRRDVSVALALQTLTTAIGAVLLALVIPLVGVSVGDVRVLYVALIGMIAMPAQSVLLSSFRGREQHGRYAWVNAASVTVATVGGILVLMAGADVLVYATTVASLTIGITVIGWTFSGMRPRPFCVDLSLLNDCREFIRGGLPFLVGNLALSVTGGIDRVLLGLFAPVAEVGWYAAAFRVIAVPIFLPNLIITPLFPALSRSASDPEVIRRTLRQTLRVILLVMVPLNAGIIVVAPAIPALLGWPADFENAIPMMMVLSLQLPIVAVDMVLGVVLMAIGRQGPWVTAQIAAAALKVAFNLLAIPLFESAFGNGATGASIVTIIMELVMFGFAVILIPKQLLELRSAWEALRIVVAGGATVAVGATLLPVAFPLAVLGGAVAYVVVAVVLRVLTMQDVHYLVGRVRKQRQADTLPMTP